MTIFHKFRLFYVPFWQYLLMDLLMLAISFFVVLMWFPLSTQVPFTKYWVFALIFSAEWLIFSYFAHRYIRVKEMRMGDSLTRRRTLSHWLPKRLLIKLNRVGERRTRVSSI